MKSSRTCSTSETEAAYICRGLKLGYIVCDALQERTETAQILRQTLEKELQCKITRRANNLARIAKFPEEKRFDNYRFEGVVFPESVSKEYLTGDGYIKDQHGLFLYGPPGTGKTHFAIASGMYACSKGLRVRFWRAYDLAEALKKASVRNELSVFLKKSKSFDLTIIDEFGFFPTDVEAVKTFFEFFCSVVYERQAFVLTSNFDFNEWISRSSEPKISEAIVDRIVHVSHLIKFTGESARFENAVMRSGSSSQSRI